MVQAEQGGAVGDQHGLEKLDEALGTGEQRQQSGQPHEEGQLG